MTTANNIHRQFVGRLPRYQQVAFDAAASPTPLRFTTAPGYRERSGGKTFSAALNLLLAACEQDSPIECLVVHAGGKRHTITVTPESTISEIITALRGGK